MIVTFDNHGILYYKLHLQS